MKRKPMKRLFALVLATCLLLAGLPLSAGAAGSPSVSGSNPFRDVASGDYFYPVSYTQLDVYKRQRTCW